jgi:hypothetical protein
MKERGVGYKMEEKSGANPTIAAFIIMCNTIVVIG